MLVLLFKNKHDGLQGGNKYVFGHSACNKLSGSRVLFCIGGFQTVECRNALYQGL